MINCNTRYLGTVLSYHIEDDVVHKIMEIPICSLEKNRQTDNIIQLDTLKLEGIDKKMKQFISLPNSLNLEFIKNFSKVSLNLVHTMLSLNPVMGNQLLRYKLDNVIYMTDGKNTSLWEPMYDSRIMYSDRRSKYLRDPSIILHEKMIPFVITFLTPDILIETKDWKFTSDANIKGKYFKTPYWEIIEDLVKYFCYFSQVSIAESKSKFISLILLQALMAQCLMKIEIIIDVIPLIAPKLTGIPSLMSILGSIGINFSNSIIGTPSYYVNSGDKLSGLQINTHNEDSIPNLIEYKDKFNQANDAENTRNKSIKDNMPLIHENDVESDFEEDLNLTDIDEERISKNKKIIPFISSYKNQNSTVKTDIKKTNSNKSVVDKKNNDNNSNKNLVDNKIDEKVSRKSSRLNYN